jgi:late competence protein required for DNA uptake (superfamily II DNA/RNA helicase)
MNYQCDEVKLSTNEMQEIYRNMKARGLSHVFCQACDEEMKPEQSRKSSTGLIMCRPCYMLNDTEATQEEIDQALEEDFPGYLASFKWPEFRHSNQDEKPGVLVRDSVGRQ